MSELVFLSASELARRIHARKISAVEMVDHYADRIEKYNPALNAIVAMDMDAARQQALVADEELAKGGPMGPLHGLPITIKDAFEVEGLTTTGGTPALKDHVPDRDADPVARLRQSGAIIMGKTNVPYLSGDFQSYNDIYGVTNNPWDLTRSPGGSSGGAAAAVSSGLSAFEIGSDIGGSVRNPTHYCGLFGLKTSFGIVPMRGHIPPSPGALASGDLAVTGPIARSAEDLDLILDCIAGAPDADPAWKLDLPPARHSNPNGLRVALWVDDDLGQVDDEYKSMIVKAAKSLEAEGARIDRNARPEFSFAEAYANFSQLMFSIVAADFPDKIRLRMLENAAELAPDDMSHTAHQLRGAALDYRQLLNLQQERAVLQAAWARFFKNIDVVLCPVAPTPAILHDHSPVSRRTLDINGRTCPYFDVLHWASLATGSYLPAAVAPIGLTKSGLPVGVQIIGPHLEDRTPIAVAGFLEEICGGFHPPPAFA